MMSDMRGAMKRMVEIEQNLIKKVEEQINLDGNVSETEQVLLEYTKTFNMMKQTPQAFYDGAKEIAMKDGEINEDESAILAIYKNHFPSHSIKE